MYRKKLYKAKKIWVIGLIVGCALIFGGTSVVNASVNTNGANYWEQSANDEQETNLYKDNSTNKSYQNYANDFNSPSFSASSDNDALTTFKNKNYRVSTFNNTQSVKSELTVKRQATDYSYSLNNGNSKNNNYQAASELSQKIAHSDTNYLNSAFTSHSTEDNDSDWENQHDVYDGVYNKHPQKVATIIGGKSNKEEIQNELKNVAYKNKPIVTYNNHGYLSFIQSSIVGHGFSDYSFDYDDGWSGYTFKDGNQLPLNHFVNSFATSNYMKGVAINMGVDTLFTSEDKNTGLIYSSNQFGFGPSSYYLTPKGIYVFYQGYGNSGWRHPFAILLPLQLIKPEYRDLFEQQIFIKYENNGKQVGALYPFNKDLLHQYNQYHKEALIISEHVPHGYTLISNYASSDLDSIPDPLNGVITIPVIPIQYLDESNSKINTNLVGSVNVDKDLGKYNTQNWEKDAFENAAIDAGFDKGLGDELYPAFGMALDFSKPLAKGIKDNGKFGEDEIKDFTSATIDALYKIYKNSKVQEAIAKRGVKIENLPKFINNSQAFDDFKETLSDSINSVEDFVKENINEDKYNNKFYHNRTQKNLNERKNALGKTRNSQLNGINDSSNALSSFITSKWKALASANPAVQAIIGFISAGLIIVLAKYIWGALFAPRMENVFGLKIKGKGVLKQFKKPKK